MRGHIKKWSDAKLDILRDDDTEFAQYAVELIRRCIASGSIGRKNEEFTRCNTCAVVIAEAAVGIAACPRCKSGDSLVTVKEAGLFSVMPEKRKELLPYHRQFNKVNIKHEVQTLENIPPRVLLSRDRQSGIDLTEFDLPGKKLDPRLGIGLLALYSAQKHGYDNVSLVQSASTLVRTVPYLSSVVTDSDTLSVPDYSYTFHAKVKPEVFNASSISYELLALQAVAQRNDINTATVDSLSRQRMNILNRFGQLAKFLDDENLPTVDLSSGSFSTILADANKKLGLAVNNSKRVELHDEVILAVAQTRRVVNFL